MNAIVYCLIDLLVKLADVEREQQRGVGGSCKPDEPFELRGVQALLRAGAACSEKSVVRRIIDLNRPKIDLK